MIEFTPITRINVDLTNPGQYFACCGLLELAARVDPNCLARFSGLTFEISADVGAVLECFFDCRVDVERSAGNDAPDDKDEFNAHRGRTNPMTLGEPFNLRLDWWTSEVAQQQKLKTWSAGQRVTDLLLGYDKKQGKKTKRVPSMREHFADSVRRCPGDWLREAWPIESPMAFSYDSRLSRNNALDRGHKADTIMAFSPAVDVLTLVGLQRFRPLTLETWTRNLYFAWSVPLPVEIAAVAAVGMIPELIDRCYQFPVKPCDAQGRYKLFGHAQPKRKPDA